MPNIVLIGMPGVGKSTIGVILAKVLGYEFIDADIVIQKEEKRLLKDIIAKEGPEGFLAIENRVNSKLEAEGAVIATGGSVVYGREAMKHLKSMGTIVYLEIGYDILKNRLSDMKDRGVVLKDGQDLKSLVEERVPLYRKYADITITEDTLTVEETLEVLLKDLELQNR